MRLDDCRGCAGEDVFHDFLPIGISQSLHPLISLIIVAIRFSHK